MRVGTDERAFGGTLRLFCAIPPARVNVFRKLHPYFYFFCAARLLFRERAHVLFLQSLSKQGHVEREKRGRLRSIPPLSRSPQLEKAVGDRPQSGRQFRGLPTLAAASGVLTATWLYSCKCLCSLAAARQPLLQAAAYHSFHCITTCYSMINHWTTCSLSLHIVTEGREKKPV